MWSKFPHRIRYAGECPRTAPAAPRETGPAPAREIEGGREPVTSSRGVRVAVLTPGLTAALAALALAVALWEDRPAASTERGVIVRYDGPVRGLVFSPDGRWIASTGGFLPSLRLSDPSGPTRWAVGLGEAGVAHELAFSPDGATLATGDAAGTVTLRGVASGAEEATIPVGTRGIYPLAFSPDGGRLACGDGTGIGTWDVGVRRLLAFRDETPGGPGTLAFSPDGRWLASADAAGSVVLRRAAAGEVEARWPGHPRAVTSVAFAPGGRSLATASSFNDPDVRLWEVPSGRPVRALRRRGFLPRAVAFSPDGRTLAAVGGRGIIVLWEAASGRELVVLRGHAGWVSSVAFSPDGRRLASGGADGTVRVWDLDRAPSGAPTPADTDPASGVVRQ